MKTESNARQIPLTQRAHEMIRPFVLPGAVVIDATAGNGTDALFLSQLIGESGTLYAVDVQESAIEATKSRIAGFYLSEYASLNHLRPPKLHLIRADHSTLGTQVFPEHHQQVACVMFNLGYLPNGDKSVKTEATGTCLAIERAIELLKRPACLSVMAYTGHPGGIEEADAVQTTLIRLAKKEDMDFQRFPTNDVPKSPIHFFLSSGAVDR